ncbi:conserved hypothetical protein [Gluconacetobacter diazotrophicus PA1 5]|uniref:Putative membrane protein n=2 Tax=Gluconacetobacter diazotrophicus TaxID=33996 RepID=A9H360_GLUDA|nr:conserved hypothetical protein [Gluconacetobacter diazotrophicus PA1 5]TWA97897.1 hypothetical protein FBZ86_1704 [Gluconacetobacter diazotrophicus]CAP54243.1 putative membrane protein [Gluconacetobacter diazotrophicus PA1 5]
MTESRTFLLISCSVALLCAASAGYGQTLPGGMAATYHMERDVDQWQLFVANDDSDARLVSHQGDLFIGIKARRGLPSLRVTLGNGGGLSPNYTMDIGNREFSAGRNGLVLEDDQLDGFVRALTSSTTATVETSRGISSLSLSGARGLIYLLYSRTAKPSRADAENSPLYNGDAERVALSSDPDVSAAEQAGPSRVSDPTASLQDPDANRSASSPDNSAYEVRARPGGRTTAISGIQPISFRNMDWTQDSREEAGGYHAIIIFGCFLIAYLCLFYILSVPFVIPTPVC